MKRLRVIVDFQETEQLALQALCQADYRLPDDQIRWLIVNTAKQRGLWTMPTRMPVNATQLNSLPTGPTPEQI